MRPWIVNIIIIYIFNSNISCITFTFVLIWLMPLSKAVDYSWIIKSLDLGLISLKMMLFFFFLNDGKQISLLVQISRSYNTFLQHDSSVLWLGHIYKKILLTNNTQNVRLKCCSWFVLEFNCNWNETNSLRWSWIRRHCLPNWLMLTIMSLCHMSDISLFIHIILYGCFSQAKL